MRKLSLTFYICIFLINGLQAQDVTKKSESETDESGATEAYVNITDITIKAENTLEDIETGIKVLIRNLMKQASPLFLNMGFKSKASSSCLLDLVSFYFATRRLEDWAFKMMDSAGKLSGGLLEGTSSALGDYDECLDVVIGGGPLKRRSHTGAYCLLEIKPPEPILNALKDYQIYKKNSNNSLARTNSFLGFLRKIRTNPNHVMFRYGICMPSSCNEFDVQDVISILAEEIDLSVEVARCESRKSSTFEWYQLLIIAFMSLFVGLVLTGTLLHILYEYRNPNKDISSKPPTSGSGVWKSAYCRIYKVMHTLTKFSLSINVQKLLSCEKEGDAFDAIRGIKVLTVISTIFAHTYALPHPLHLYRFRDTLNFSKFIDEVLFGTIANSSVGVDTFFFIAGFICIYNRWRLIKKPGVLLYIIKFICLTYIRMIAAQALVLSLFFLLPLLGSGPLWHDFIDKPLENCVRSGWMNLLFIQNFLGPYDICLYQTWILGTMMQMFIMTAVVVWAMHRWPLTGVVASVSIVVASSMAVAIVTVVQGFPATFTVYFYDYRTSLKLWNYLYVQSYCHIGPFCIGMLAAYFIAEYPLRKCNKLIAISAWLGAFSTCCSIIFGLHHYRDGEEMSRGLAVFYASLHRPAWALSLAWMVYACASGYGGAINSILSWKSLVPLERLCYLAYLLHIPLMFYQGGVQRERMFMGHYNQIMCFIAYAVASFILSVVCYLLFQAPYEVFESWISGKPLGNIWQVDPTSVSEESLKKESPKCPRELEENSKVLYNRHALNDVF